jgi:C-terminal peptidase prc
LKTSKVGHISLRHFNDNEACEKIDNAIDEMTRAGAASLVLDLRGNGGGLLKQAICIGELFVGERVIAQVRRLGSRGAELNPVPSQGQRKVTDLPLVILIDAQSASASELVAAALQDYGRAWIIGERSFGKGTVQSGSPYSRNSGLLYFKTTERFYSPLGRTHQLHGVEPDVTVPAKPNATEDERFSVREADEFPNALSRLGNRWKQKRPEKAAALGGCVKATAPEKRWNASQGVSAMAPDYQLLSAEAAAVCAAKKSR